jgi:hypothetical protein
MLDGSHRILIRSCCIAAFFVAVHAPAQVARVFLSGTGDDLNDCSNMTTPCRSLQGAINQAATNGVVIVMSSGGFGAANITKSLTINAPPGVVAFDARTINVTLGAADKVVIRGLTLNGSVFGDAIGINFNNLGTLVVEDSIISGFGNGIFQAGGGSSLLVKNCDLRTNLSGIAAGPAPTPLSTLTIERSRFVSNPNYGVWVSDNFRTIIRDSVAAGNGTGFALDENVAGGSMLLDGCVASANTYGITANATNQVAAVIRVTNSSIFANTYGVNPTGSGQIVSYGTNHLWRSPYAPSDSGAFSSTTARQ